MDYTDDIHLDVCQNIEVGLKIEYERNPKLTDNMCIFGLDNAVIAVNHEFGFSRGQKIASHPDIEGVIKHCVDVGLLRVGKINDLTLKEYLARLEKVKKSVKRHSAYGVRGYYDFIKNYV